ncbi:hypothetical protein H312_01895 [Anncaliia algerae PRA339]|uniref:Uncharacterized protein n=1 Tax=Anncaliia algerae PRA339 TaxID=1288291 RepID=A0A059F0Q1_9MICR|nr:hypothetical protein H312_01895 [Anncaliia algerae PRA339]
MEQEIKKLFLELKEQSSPKDQLINLEIQERKLNKKLKDLEREKETYLLLSRNLVLEEDEAELREIEEEINNFKISTEEVNSVDQLVILSDTYFKKDILENKVLQFFTNNIFIKNKKINFKNKIINCNLIYFDKRIEDALNNRINTECIKECLIKKLNELMSQIEFYLLKIYMFDSFVGFLFKSKKQIDEVEFSTEINEVNIKELEESLPSISSVLSKIIKDKMIQSIYSDDFDYESVSSFNGLLEDSSLQIKNFDDFVLDFFVKEIIKISKNEPRKDSLIQENNLLFSNEIKIMKKYFINLQKNTSKRKEKGLEIAQRSLTKYFTTCKSIESLYIYFNDLMYLQSNIESEKLEVKLSEIKEKIFCNIIYAESIDAFDLPLMDLRVFVKKRIYDFEERMEFFLKEKNQFLFKTSFFEKTFDNFINYILKKEYLTKEGGKTEALKCDYLIQQCFISPKEIFNHKKIILLRSLLNCDRLNEAELRGVFDLNILYKFLQIMPWNNNLENILS